MEQVDLNNLMLKNERLIQMVIERAKRDFPEDIAMIGLTGSFSTGDYHAKSDLDLIIINNTPLGWGIASCFILGDVGYDIYCTPWETRIEDAASLKSPYVSHLVDMEILYCAKPEYLEKFEVYRQRALQELAKPIGPECIDRAKLDLDQAKQCYADAWLSDSAGEVRKASFDMVIHLFHALSDLNNTYMKRGIKRYMDEVRTYRHMPDRFEELYGAVIDAKTVDDLRTSACTLLKEVVQLCSRVEAGVVEQPVPAVENLVGTYEELWCNCRNKVLASIASGDKSYACLAALGAQSFLDDMTIGIGTKKLDLLQDFDSDHLELFETRFLQAMEDYLEEYTRVGREVVRYDTFEELYRRYMGN